MNFLNFISLIILINSSSIIRLPFKRINPDSSQIKQNNFTSVIFESNLYTEIIIGSNNQKIPMKLSFENYHSFITIYNYTGDFIKYNPDQSTTYQKIYGERFYTFINIKKGITSEENFILKDINNKEISCCKIKFILATAPNFNISGDFGMSPSTKDEQYNQLVDFNFILNLHKNSYIKYNIFSIIFFNKDSGEIIIGDKPNEYLDYNFDLFIESNIPIDKDGYFWGLQYISSSVEGKSLYFSDQIAEFSIESYVIKPHSCYKKKIDELFFNEQVKNGKCIFVNESGVYSFYHCAKNINLSKFPKLYLYQRILNYTFELNEFDLFEDFGDRKLFLMNFVDEASTKNKWVLGIPFLKKYNFTYNFDSKTIGIYFGIKEEIKQKKKFNKMWIYLIICIIIIFVFAIVIIYLIKNMPRKKRLNELDEYFDFQSNKDNNGNKNIDSENENNLIN